MIIQLLTNSLLSGLLLSLVAIGFNGVFSTTRVFHIAHGAVYVAGGYFFLWFNSLYPSVTIGALVLKSAFALIAGAVLGLCIEIFIYQPLNRKKMGEAPSLIVSTGVYLVIINIIALCFSNETQVLDLPLTTGYFSQYLILTPTQLIQFVIVVLLIITLYFLSRTGIYLKIKAVQGNAAVSSVFGVNVNLVRMTAMVVSSLLAVVVSILKLFDTGLDPHTGMTVTLTASVAVIVAGNKSFLGIIAASILICTMQTASEWFFSAQWKETITFILLILIVVFRTEGLLSFNMRVEEQ